MSRIHIAAHRLTAIEIIVVSGAVALAVVSDRFLLPALVIALVYELVLVATGTVSVQDILPPPSLAIALLLFLLAANVFVSAFRNTTIIQVPRTVLGVIWYTAIARVGHHRHDSFVSQRQPMVLELLLIATLMVGLALAMASPFIVEWEGATKLPLVPAGFYQLFSLQVSDPVNPNVMAGTLALILPLGFALIVQKRVAPAQSVPGNLLLLRVLGAISCVTTAVMLLLMQSRSALVAVAAAVCVVVALRWPRTRWPLLLIAAGIGVVLATAPQSSLRLLLGSSSSGIGEVGQRVEIWSRALHMIADFPITGIGMGTFSQVGALLYPLPVTTHGVPHAHNLFLQVAVDLGIPGFIAWMGILVYAFVSAWRAYRHGRGWLRALGAGLLASNVALCVHGLTDAVTWGIVRTAPLVWGLWGIALAAEQTALASRQTESSSIELTSNTP